MIMHVEHYLFTSTACGHCTRRETEKAFMRKDSKLNKHLRGPIPGVSTSAVESELIPEIAMVPRDLLLQVP